MAVGEDPTREGLVGTPDRVARAYLELLAGYGQNPSDILGSAAFNSEGYDQMVILKDVSFYSLCEHHLLPFIGSATVAYIPSGGRVVGLSKLARLVDCFARRFQIQERMTHQIADALKEHLNPRGWGVTVRAQHLCMCARGVGKPNAAMVTTALGGAIREDEKARLEYMRSCG